MTMKRLGDYRVRRPAMTEEQKAARDLEQKRQAWTKAKSSGVTITEAKTMVRAIFAAANVRGGVVRSDDRDLPTDLIVSRGWGLECSLYVTFEQDYARRVVNPDNDRDAAGTYVPKVAVSWSSTGRNVAAAHAAVSLYAEVIALAAEVESVLGDRPIRWVWSLDETQAPTPQAPVVVDEIEKALDGAPNFTTL